MAQETSTFETDLDIMTVETNIATSDGVQAHFSIADSVGNLAEFWLTEEQKIELINLLSQ